VLITFNCKKIFTCPVVVHSSVTYLTVNAHNKFLSNKFITHIQPSTGFGTMVPASGGVFYIMSKRNCIKYTMTIYMP
jgi:hypothetical protein